MIAGGHPQPDPRLRAARWCAGAARTGRESAAEVLDPPIVAVTATGTVVVPPSCRDVGARSAPDVGLHVHQGGRGRPGRAVSAGRRGRRAPTTVGTDVLHGLDAAVAAATAGLRPVGDVPWYVCSSAGGGLRLAVVGYEALVTARGRATGSGCRPGRRWCTWPPGRLDAARRRRAAGGPPGCGAAGRRHRRRRRRGADAQRDPAGRGPGWRVPVVVAGNADARDEAGAALLAAAGVPVTAADNVLPRIGVLDAGAGPGGDPGGVPAARHRRQAAVAGRPVRAAGAGGHPGRGAHRRGGARRRASAGTWLVVDVGGATTDVYSVLTPDERAGGPRPGGRRHAVAGPYRRG